MSVTVLALSALVFASLAGNAFLFFRLKRLKSKTKNTYSQDAKELLAYLMQGEALVQIRVIDPTGLIMRSPR